MIREEGALESWKYCKLSNLKINKQLSELKSFKLNVKDNKKIDVDFQQRK